MKTRILQFRKAMGAALFFPLQNATGKRNAFLKTVKAGSFKQLFLFALMLLAFAATTKASPIDLGKARDLGTKFVNSNTSNFNWDCNEDGNGCYAFDTLPGTSTYQIVVLLADPSIGGIVGDGSYYEGALCTLIAIPDVNYTFTCWVEDGTGEVVSTSRTYSFYVTGNRTLWANFEPRVFPNHYTITATANPSVAGTVSGARSYLEGECCTLTATPAAGYVFTNWTENGAVVSTSSSYSFEVAGARALVANFEPIIAEYTITATTNPLLAGMVSGAGTYPQGQTCTLTATANEDYEFVSWMEDGEVVSSNASYSFAVTGDRILSAQFVPSELVDNIVFADANVKALCVANWDTNGSGELSYAEAAAVTSLGQVFRYNTSISSFDELQYFIGLTSIGCSAFEQCTSLTTIELPNSVTSIGNYAFEQCTSLTSIELSNSVTSIGDEAFRYCTGLTTIELPNSVTSIGDGAFNHCTGLASMTVLAENPPTLYSNFSDINQSILVYVPCGSLNAYASISWGGITNFVEMCDGTITVSANPEEGGSVAGGESYSFGQICTVTATASEGYMFNNWTENGTVVSTDANYSFMVAGNRTLVANFSLNSYDISASPDPVDGGTITGTGSYNFGETATLTATSNEGYTFTSWAENGTVVSTSVEYSFVVTGSRSLVANFSINSYNISATINPTNSGTVTGIGNYNYGETATLTAIDNEGYTFVEWRENGDIVSTNRSYIFQVTGSRNLVAKFVLNSYYIGTSANPSNGGIVTGSGNYHHGATANLTAAASNNYVFSNWTENGNVVSTDANYSFTVTEARSLVANFAPALVNYYTVIASANPTEGGIINGTGTYQEGETCTLVATAHTDYSFTNWTKDGEIVSTESVYSFTVTEDATYVANFEEIQVVYYNISANSNPSTGGSVTGAGTYMSGQTCTLTAIANEDHAFVNWTENGNVVSTDANYSFTVTGNRTLVANFTLQGPLTNHWTPIGGTQYNMTISGIILIDGVEQTVTTLEVGAFCGDECRGSMTAEFFPPTQQYVVSLTVASNQQSGEIITFRLYDQVEGQELDLQCTNSITFESNAIIGGVGDWYQFAFSDEVSVTATVNPEGAGTVTGTGNFMPGTMATLTATANSGYSFREWRLNGETVSTDNPYTFIVNGATNLVAQFDIQQISTLQNGWSWWSTYIEMDGNNGLQQLEESLGYNGLMIKTQTPYVQNYYPSLGYNYWFGPLTNVGLTNEAGYQISVSNACQAVVSGAVADAAAHPVTIQPGWNWIGYPVATQQSLSAGLANFTPTANDLIKGQNSSATFYDNYGWFPTSFALTPGQGYMYLSNATENKTLTYSIGRGDNELVKAPERIWTNDEHAFAGNLTVMAVVVIDGEEQRSEELELGAFVGGECRGSAVLVYFEPTDRWYAILTIAGEEGEEINFAVINRRKANTNARSINRVVFVENAVLGNLDQPYEVNFSTSDALRVYPNPVERNEAFTLNIPSDEKVAEVFVCNALGDIVLHNEGKQDGQQISGIAVSGVYTVKVVCKSGNIYVGRLIVK